MRDALDAGEDISELRWLATQMCADLGACLQAYSPTFSEIEMPVDAARQLIKVAIDRFIDTRFATEVSFEVPDDVLRRFPEPVRTFFRPTLSERPTGAG